MLLSVVFCTTIIYLCASLRISLLREVFSRLFDVSRARALCGVPAHRRRRALLRLVMLIIVSRNSLILLFYNFLLRFCLICLILRHIILASIL